MTHNDELAFTDREWAAWKGVEEDVYTPDTHSKAARAAVFLSEMPAAVDTYESGANFPKDIPFGD